MMKAIVRGYDGVKYNEYSTVVWEQQYTFDRFEVVTIDRDEVLKEADEEMVDEYNEYVIIHFTDGDTATFRNSHVDLFSLH